MKNYTSILISVFIISFLFSTTVVAQNNDISIQKVSANSSVKLNRISIRKTDSGYILEGRVKRRSRNTIVTPGHIDIVIKNGKNQTEIQKVITYKPARLSKHSRFGSKFQLNLPDNLSGSAISIRWHNNSSKQHQFISS